MIIHNLLFRDTYDTILGCCNSFNNDISRNAVDGTPSSSPASKRIFFNATKSPVILSFALYTIP